MLQMKMQAEAEPVEDYLADFLNLYTKVELRVQKKWNMLYRDSRLLLHSFKSLYALTNNERDIA